MEKNQAEGTPRGPQSNLPLKAGLASKSFIFKVLLPYLSALDQ